MINMKEYIKDFIKDIEIKIRNKHIFTPKEIKNVKEKIVFFQHERLIHLLVTLFYVLFTLSFLAFSLLSPIFLIIFFILLAFLILYIRHYFFLENAVQYIYKLYDMINK